MNAKFKIICTGLLAVALTACTPVTANRGHIVDPDKLSQIKTGTSTREDVAATLGSPSHVATFDENTWYYFGRRTEQESFFDPEAIDRKVVKIAFDESGIVKSIDDKTGDGAEDIDVVERTTPTYGRENTLIQDLFGGIGRPGIPGQKRQGPLDR